MKILEILKSIGTFWASGNEPRFLFQFKRFLKIFILNGLAYGDYVYISLKQTTNRITILIEDDGPGINDEQFKNKFLVFVCHRLLGIYKLVAILNIKSRIPTTLHGLNNKALSFIQLKWIKWK